MGRHSHDGFLTSLDKCFNRVRSNGSLFITLKRVVPKAGKHGVDKKTADGGPQCLIRAKLGKQAVSTVVTQKDVGTFHEAFSTIMRGNMDALKKPEKKKEDKKEKKEKKEKKPQEQTVPQA